MTILIGHCLRPGKRPSLFCACHNGGKVWEYRPPVPYSEIVLAGKGPFNTLCVRRSRGDGSERLISRLEHVLYACHPRLVNGLRKET